MRWIQEQNLVNNLQGFGVLLLFLELTNPQDFFIDAALNAARLGRIGGRLFVTGIADGQLLFNLLLQGSRLVNLQQQRFGRLIQACEFRCGEKVSGPGEFDSTGQHHVRRTGIVFSFEKLTTPLHGSLEFDPCLFQQHGALVHDGINGGAPVQHRSRFVANH